MTRVTTWMLRLPWLRLVLTCAAGALIYVGERIAAPTAARPWLGIFGVLLLVAGATWTGWLTWRARGTTLAAAWRWALAPQGAFLLAGAAYGIVLLFGAGAAANSWVGPLRYAWALLLTMGAVVLGFVELALWRLRDLGAGEDADRSGSVTDLDAMRVDRAAASGLWLALLVGLIATIAFGAQRLAWQWDLTYFKTTEPSEATRALVRGLPEPIQVGLFFPTPNPVASQLDSYLRQVARGASRLSYEAWDADLAPQEAMAFQARGNGWVILKRGEQVKPLQVPLKLENARAALRRFDSDFLAGLAEVSRDPRVVYETIGHGERIEQNRANAAPDNLDRFSLFDSLLRARNFKVQTLDYAKGLGSQIPSDAFLVIIAGPTEPFLRGEADALRAYLKRGGRLMVFLEPGESVPGPGGLKRPARSADPLLAVLAEYGLGFDPVPLANDRYFFARTHTIADLGLLVTNAYEPHPAVAPLRVNSSQFPLGIFGAGSLKLLASPSGFKVQPTVKAMPGTWGDKNHNFRFDPPGEVREDAVLAAVIEPSTASTPAVPGTAKPDAGPMLAVFADADLASDLLIQNRANVMLVSAGLDWLSGQEPGGAPNLEEDQRIQHVRGEEWLWFYLPVIGVPAALLGLGLWRLRRRSRGMLVGRAA